jgi:hypothetical protein
MKRGLPDFAYFLVKLAVGLVSFAAVFLLVLNYIIALSYEIPPQQFPFGSLYEAVPVASSVLVFLVAYYSIRVSVKEWGKKREFEFALKRLDEFYSPLLGYFMIGAHERGRQIENILVTRSYLRTTKGIVSPLQVGGRIEHFPADPYDHSVRTYSEFFDPPDDEGSWDRFVNELWGEYVILLGMLARFRNRVPPGAAKPNFPHIGREDYTAE